MARKIVDFDGSVGSVSGTWPFGNILDAPSGTVVNRKVHTDLLQTFYKLAEQAGVTLNSLDDNATNGYQFMQAMVKVMSNHVAAMVLAEVGQLYSSSTVYIISGCENANSDGYALYNGGIYYVKSSVSPACGPGLVPVFRLPTVPVYDNGVLRMGLDCAASGSGIANYSAAVFVNKWQSFTPAIGAGPGGSFSVASGDIVYAKYLIKGKTCDVQIGLRTFSVTGGPAFMSLTLPFLATASIGYNNANQVGAYYLAPSGANLLGGVRIVNGTPCNLQVRLLGNWEVGTDDSGLDIAVRFELS